MSDLIYLDNYILQQDMRIRMPKQILSNLGAEKGKTRFDIYFDSSKRAIVLIPTDKESKSHDEA